MKNKGFTLVEIIVVLAIISILSLMVVPNMKAYTRKKGIIQVETQCKIVRNAVNLYNSENIKDMIKKDDDIINVLEKLNNTTILSEENKINIENHINLDEGHNIKFSAIEDIALYGYDKSKDKSYNVNNKMWLYELNDRKNILLQTQ